MEYLIQLKGFTYLNFFLNLYDKFIITSCKIPRGHKKEQYILPKKIVKNNIMIKQTAIGEIPNITKLKNVGIN